MVQAAAGGLQIGGGQVTAAANAITTEFQPALTVPAATGPVTVAGYGAFHVVLRVGLAGGGSVEATIVQGSPVLWLRFRDARPALSGAWRDTGGSDGRARLEIAGRRWDVLGSGLKVAAAGLTGTGSQLAVAPVPAGVAAAAWCALARACGHCCRTSGPRWPTGRPRWPADTRTRAVT